MTKELQLKHGDSCVISLWEFDINQVTQYVIILPYITELFIYLYLLFQDTLNMSPSWLTYIIYIMYITHHILCMYRVYGYSVDILIIAVSTAVNHTHICVYIETM